jgi:hypothetical protein
MPILWYESNGIQSTKIPPYEKRTLEATAAMAQYKLSVQDRLKGCRKNLKSKKSPAWLKKSLAKQIAKLEAETKN